jgi:hypothetical protein
MHFNSNWHVIYTSMTVINFQLKKIVACKVKFKIELRQLPKSP